MRMEKILGVTVFYHNNSWDNNSVEIIFKKVANCYLFYVSKIKYQKKRM